MRRIFPVLMFSAALVSSQPAAPPSFEELGAAGASFKGKPAAPVLKTKDQRQFRTAIRDGAASGPNFAGHFTIVQWGCGAGCVSIVVVDAVNGAISSGPFRFLSWELRKYEGKIASNDDKFEPLAFRLNSRLLIARGCPEETNCASYFYEWTGGQFKLIRQIPSEALVQ